MIHLGCVLKRNDTDLLASELGSEMVIMDMNSGDYLGLNEVGTDIWRMLQQPITANDIINNLLTLYEVSKEDCEKQTLAYLGQMLERNIITISV